MNIAVDLISIKGDGSVGGATGVALELIKGFASREENVVVVLCAAWNIDYLKSVLPENIVYCQLQKDGLKSKLSMFNRWFWGVDKASANKVLQKHNIDILFCPFTAPTYRDNKIPTVCIIHDVQHEFYPEFFSANELRIRRNFYKEIVSHVENVVCVSEYTRKTFCEKYGFPKERAITIYNAVQKRLKKEDLNILDKLSLKENEYMVYSANFWKHKNHERLIKAFGEYVQAGGRLKLVLTGNPLGDNGYYSNLISEMGLCEQVIITGYLSEEELYSVLLRAKGFIYPSLFEGFGIPVIEAMYLNKLIACSNTTSLPEVGCDSICYFDPENIQEIVSGIRFIEENEMNDSIIEDYNINLKKYSRSNMINSYMLLFNRILDARKM